MSMQISIGLKDYITAGYPAIVLNTSEEERAIEECYRIARKKRMKLYVWSETGGIINYYVEDNGNIINEIVDKNVSADEEALEKGVKYGKGIIYCMLDFHPYIKSPLVWRTAKDVFDTARCMNISYVFISSKFEIPFELEHAMAVTDLELPKKEELRELAISASNKYKIPITQNTDNAADTALGLTRADAGKAFAISIVKKRNLDVDIINGIKRQIICKNGLLEYMQSKETLETVGGVKGFKSYAQERFLAYSEEAQAYGLPYPKGVLLVGIPGCGKSLVAKALSNMWQKPLLRFDIGKLFGSLVGDTEKNTREALKIAEAMAPAILWIDEIEKGLSGIGSSGKTDSGVTSRMFGSILTWMQEKEKPVYVIATANNTSSLPPEFLRKGRFDEIFFVDLPNEEERREIFRIQIEKKNREAKNFDIAELAKLSDGYTGAEIEEVVVSSMFHAWNDGKREFTTEDLSSAISKIHPMSKGIMSNTVTALRKWSKDFCIRNANVNPEIETKSVNLESEDRSANAVGDFPMTLQLDEEEE